jgi:hypothetical protein
MNLSPLRRGNNLLRSALHTLKRSQVHLDKTRIYALVNMLDCGNEFCTLLQIAPAEPELCWFVRGELERGLPPDAGRCACDEKHFSGLQGDGRGWVEGVGRGGFEVGGEVGCDGRGWGGHCVVLGKGDVVFWKRWWCLCCVYERKLVSFIDMLSGSEAVCGAKVVRLYAGFVY